jgi:signal peptidase II
LNLKILFRPYIYASIIAALDLYIKYIIRTNNIQENIIIDNFLTIDLTYNTGIAFGLFSEYTLVTYFFSIIVFSWLIFQFRNVKQNTLEFYSLILILGGAIGNLG